MCLSICSFAQITLTDADVVSIGDSRIQKTDLSPDGISIGNSGANQDWDFSSLSADESYEISFVDPNETVSGADFPDATLAAEMNGDYLYLSNSSEALYIMGYGGDFGSFVFEMPELILEFPTQYEDQFGFTYQFDSLMMLVDMDAEMATGLQFLMPGIVAAKMQLDTASISTVDAWGTATIEETDYDVLRIQKVSSATDTVFGIVPVGHQILASDYQIFSPDDITINLFDTVFFSNLGMHDAVEVDEATWNANGTTSNGGFEYYADAYHVFTEPGTYYYVCTPHIGNGMKGKITVEENWTFIMSDVFSSGETTTSYSWFTDDENIGMPLIELSFDTDGSISEATYISNDDVLVSWNCVEDACVDPEDGSGEYGTLADCEDACNNTAIETVEAILDIYPNPAKNEINVLQEGVKEIYSFLGEKLIETTQKNIDISSLPTGVYLIKSEGKMHKFVKE